MEIEQEILGFSPEGEVIIRYTLTNKSELKVTLLNIGAAITSIEVPNNKGEIIDILLGYPTYKNYLSDSLNMGKCVGRYAGRVAKSRFNIDDTTYKLSSNSGTTHLNGGVTPFSQKIWSSRVEQDMVVFSYVSAPLEEGYPGEFGVEVGYSLSEESELQITIIGESDQDTIVNIAPYLYFNLNGISNLNNDVSNLDNGLDMELKIDSSKYVPLTSKMLIKGEISDVENTPMDFRDYKIISKDIDCDFENLQVSQGYDNYWIIDKWQKGVMNNICSLRSISSGIEMDVKSTQPALYFSSCGEIEDCGLDINGNDLKNGAGVIVSAQNVSNLVDNENFITPILRLGEIYQHHTIYKFNKI